MSSFILQLLIILAFGLMVQSAPINDVTKRSTHDKDMNQIKLLEMSLFCTAEKSILSNETRKELEDFNLIPPYISQDKINNTIKTIANKAFNHFSDRCKNFTKAMTLKHRFQEHLFSDNISVELVSDNAKTLSRILTGLQSLAKIFNDLEFNQNNSRCVKLTPDQYRIMYHVLYTAPLLESYKAVIGNWFISDGPPLYTQNTKHC